MSGRGTYLPHSSKSWIPRAIVTVSLSPLYEGRPGDRGITVERWGSAVVCASRIVGGKWVDAAPVTAYTEEELRDSIRVACLPERTVWVIAHKLDQMLALSRWWDYAERTGIKWIGQRRVPAAVEEATAGVCNILVSQVAIGSTVGILKFCQGGRKYVYLSGSQFGIGSRGGCQRPPTQDRSLVKETQSGQSGCTSGTYESAAGMLREARGIFDWWKRNARSAIGLTVGQCALSWMRSHAKPRSLCTHTDSRVHHLERLSAIGGRASVWYVGEVGRTGLPPRIHSTPDGERKTLRIPGPLTHLDVRSMYAHLMATKLLPSSLIRHISSITPRSLDALCDTYGVVARVTIRTDTPEYPLRTSSSVQYPIGTFNTTLTAPELISLRKDGQILAVHEAALYELTDALQPAAQKLLDAATEAEKSGDESVLKWIKALRNTMAGRLAMRSGRWVRHQKADGWERWGEHWIRNIQAGTAERYRWICGLAWRWDDSESDRGPYTAAFSTLAAHGRTYIREIRSALPQRSVVSQDTDGLWIVGECKHVCGLLASRMGENPGQLRVVANADTARFWGPRHYVFDGSWVLSGFCEPVVSEEGSRIWDIRRSAPFCGKMTEPPRECLEYTRQSYLTLTLTGGRVGPDGWVKPIVRDDAKS